MEAVERVCEFLKDAKTYYLATVDGDQPRVRPFGTEAVYEGKLYIQTGKIKDVSKQLAANPKFEICAFKDGKWIRISGKLVNDDRVEAKEFMLDNYPHLRRMYSATNGHASFPRIWDAHHSASSGRIFCSGLRSGVISTVSPASFLTRTAGSSFRLPMPKTRRKSVVVR